ncbi:hypothetical protein SAMN02745116_01899 [Pilibacter termitis]|uniref:YozE SAM-like fold n=1 Tax=Pilibacter termitis TaxID=263852 RepID=A0A1T4PRN0_9ENTE|nr:hypothetical protein [Pilibacter termitis]SJZ94079.1 hypothetical protein SAMN02745116_01899 [Pilibacter termitis]
MKFKQWLEIGNGTRDSRFDVFYEFASNEGKYPWRKGYAQQINYLMKHYPNDGHLEVLRDAYFQYLTVWL